MNRPATAAARAQPQVLDPSTLGRPVHLLERFSASLRSDLSTLLQQGLNRRYRAGFEIERLTLQRCVRPATERRWLAYGSAHGLLHASFDRSLLLAVLSYRYGLPVIPEPNDAETPETHSEERLAQQLSGVWLARLVRRIELGLAPAEVPADAEPGLSAAGDAAPPPGAWIAEIALHDRSSGLRGLCTLALSASWMTHLLERLAPRQTTVAPPSAQPFPAQLQLRLQARLLRREMSLGELLELRVGDVIPVSMGATEVAIDDSCLFTATVAEHQGKLCLTAFEDLE